MSSDLFDVRIKSVNETEVIFDVLTTGAAGFDHLADTSSFALVLLSDALCRAAEDVSTDAERNRLREKSKAAPLLIELQTAEEDWYVSESWMEDNLDRFIADCEVLERRNDVGKDELRRREDAIVDQFGGTLSESRKHEWNALRWEKCHNYTLRVQVTETRWCEHLEPGLEFGTAAFDV
jgi:hypothetical protein